MTVVVALVIVGVFAGLRLPWPGNAAFAQDRAAADLVSPVRPPDKGEWKFFRKQDNRPVSFDPCHTIHYVVHVGRGPVNGLALAQEGVARLSRATGFKFAFDGMTDHIPTAATLPQIDEPLWIGWAEESETDVWAHQADVVGIGGSEVVVNGRGHQVRGGGYAMLRPDPSLPATFGPGGTTGGVLLHELGHVVGLDHVQDSRQIMFESVAPTAGGDYETGDLRGLWEIGAVQGCL